MQYLNNTCLFQARVKACPKLINNLMSLARLKGMDQYVGMLS